MGMTSDQAHKLMCAAIYKGPKVETPASRVKARRAAKEAKVQALREAITRIKGLAREMPAWELGYFSAITSLELQIKEIEVSA